LKFSVKYVTKRAVAATEKSEVIVCKIRNSNMTSISEEKLKPPGKIRKPSSKRIELDDFDFCPVR
jgi:hypothetical protein